MDFSSVATDPVFDLATLLSVSAGESPTEKLSPTLSGPGNKCSLQERAERCNTGGIAVRAL